MVEGAEAVEGVVESSEHVAELDRLKKRVALAIRVRVTDDHDVKTVVKRKIHEVVSSGTASPLIFRHLRVIEDGEGVEVVHRLSDEVVTELPMDLVTPVRDRETDIRATQGHRVIEKKA